MSEEKNQLEREELERQAIRTLVKDLGYLAFAFVSVTLAAGFFAHQQAAFTGVYLGKSIWFHGHVEDNLLSLL